MLGFHLSALWLLSVDVGTSYRLSTKDSIQKHLQNRSGGWPVRWFSQLHLKREDFAGAFGVVKLVTFREECARDIAGAVKTQKPPNPFLWNLALNELRFMGQLQGPHFISTWDVKIQGNCCDGQVLNLMEGVTGGTLSGMVQKGTDSDKQHALIFLDLLKGAKQMQEKKIVHRDIKGANIMVTAGRRGKIADLGLACGGEPLIDKCGGIAGSARFFSPELWEELDIKTGPYRYEERQGFSEYMANASTKLTEDLDFNTDDLDFNNSLHTKNNQLRRISHKNDVWALGLVLYQLAFRVEGPEPIFKPKTLEEVKEAVLTFQTWLQTDPLYINAADPVKELLDHMFQARPKERFDAAQLLPLAESWAVSLGATPSELKSDPDTQDLPSCFKRLASSPLEKELVASSTQ